MCHILMNNPESFRDWQYGEYQRSLDGDHAEQVRCDICGGLIAVGEEVALRIKPGHEKYACESCIDAEIKENELSRKDAIEALVDLADRYE